MLYLVTAIFAFPMIGRYSFVSAIFPYFYNCSCYDKYPILASNCKTLLCFPCIFFIVQWNFLVDKLTVCALHSEFLWSLFHTYIYYFQTELNSKHTKQTILIGWVIILGSDMSHAQLHIALLRHWSLYFGCKVTM